MSARQINNDFAVTCGSVAYFYEEDTIESMEEALCCYKIVFEKDGLPSESVSIKDFVSLSLHSIQQCGGKLLYKDKELKATSIHQTGGLLGEDNELTENDVLQLEGQSILLATIINED